MSGIFTTSISTVRSSPVMVSIDCPATGMVGLSAPPIRRAAPPANTTAANPPTYVPYPVGDMSVTGRMALPGFPAGCPGHAGVIGPSLDGMLEWIDARLAGEDAPSDCP